MTELSQMSCISVEKGAARLPAHEIEHFHQQVKDWQIVTEDGEQRLKRTFKFKNFAEALDFTNQVGKMAENQNHHPALLTEWGRVTVAW